MASKAKRKKAGRAPRQPVTHLCSLRQAHHGVWLEVVLVLPAEHSSDDDDDDRDHGDGRQHRGDDPQVVGWVLHHGCGKSRGKHVTRGTGRGRVAPTPLAPSHEMVNRVWDQKVSCLGQVTPSYLEPLFPPL